MEKSGSQRMAVGEADRIRIDAVASRVIGLRYPWWRLGTGAAVAVLAAVVAASQGSVHIPLSAVVEMVAAQLPGVGESDHPNSWSTILWQLRLPRVTLALIVGGGLAMAGAAYQGLFKNPLADPYLVGVASGSGLAATIVLLTGVPLYFAGIGILPIAAFCGGIAAVTVAYSVARSAHGTPLTTLILAGVAISALAASVTSLLMIRSDPDLRPVLSWLMGSFIAAEWRDSLVMLLYLGPSVIVLLGFARILNVVQLSEEHASMLGVDVERVKIALIVAATLATASAVSFSGLIGFVGLVAPHVVRILWGVDYRFLLPMSGLIGATFLVIADLVARTIVSPGELPVGVVTAFCGAPFFLFILMRRRAGGV